MDIKCYFCEKVLEDKYIRKSMPEKSRCGRCHVSWLRRTISSMENDVSMMQIQLRQYLSGRVDHSDDESTSDEDSH
jgi:hypothetical protein